MQEGPDGTQKKRDKRMPRNIQINRISRKLKLILKELMYIGRVQNIFFAIMHISASAIFEEIIDVRNIGIVRNRITKMRWRKKDILHEKYIVCKCIRDNRYRFTLIHGNKYKPGRLNS